MKSASAVLLVLLLVSLGTKGARSAPSIRVFPSGATVAQELLRISITFALPQEDSIASEMRIRQQDGSDAIHPFVDPPLWSADHRVLTLLLDPSRQKIGLRDHLKYGFVLRANQQAELRLRGRVLKTWFIERGSCAPLDPTTWSARPVRVGTLDRLIVRFSAPIDFLSQDYVAVATPQGTRVSGRSALSDAERVWSLSPATPWQRGDKLAVHPRLEDPCGNEVGEPFEHAMGKGLGERRETALFPLEILAAHRAPVRRRNTRFTKAF